MIHPIFWLLLGSLFVLVIVQCINGVVVTNRLLRGNPAPQPLVDWVRTQSNRWSMVGFLLLLGSLAMELVVLRGTASSSRNIGLFICLLTLYGLLIVFLLIGSNVMLQRWALHQREVAPPTLPQFPAQQFGALVMVFGGFFFLSGILYIYEVSVWNWLLVAVAIMRTARNSIVAHITVRSSLRATPLTASPWAALAPRIAVLEGFAGRHFQQILVVSGPAAYAANASVVGWPRATLLLGETLLRQTDWRQRDAIISHELGHLRSRRMLYMFMASLLQSGLLTFLYISLLPQLYPVALWQMVLQSAPVLALLLYSIVVGIRTLRHRIEFACDADSAYLTGDPKALLVALATLTALRGGNIKRATLTHPATAKRWERLSTLPATAPWADFPVASSHVPVVYAERLLTKPSVTSEPPLPLPPAPWDAIPAGAPERQMALVTSIGAASGLDGK